MTTSNKTFAAVTMPILVLGLASSGRIAAQAQGGNQAPALRSQHGAATPEWGASGDIQSFHVQGNVHLLVGAGGNIAVQTGDDGILVVDTGHAAHADKV